MSAATDAANQTLAAARTRNDPPALADALSVHANLLVQRGQLREARNEIDEAVAIYHQLGRREDEARYGLLAATLTRLLREFAEARIRVERSLALAEPGSPTTLAATVEGGEIALAEGTYAEAAEWFRRGLLVEHLQAQKRLEVLRKLAVALAALQEFDAANEALDQARQLALELGDERTASVVVVEQVTVRQQSPDQADADMARGQAIEAAKTAGDHFALAQLYVLEATRAIEQRDQDRARSALVQARGQALDARAPITYMTAAIALAELDDAMGDRLGAYESLARAWATLSDVLGPDAARAAIQPKLEALRTQWGNSAFDAIRTEYETRRRAELHQR